MNTVMTPQVYWDKAADSKEFTTAFQIKAFEQNISRDAQILDVGCGYGRTMNELYESGFFSLTGIDFSQKMIDRGNALYPHLCFKKMENNQFPFDDNCFDAVILLAVLTCIIQDDEQEKLIKEIRRVLRGSGVLYINDFLINSDPRNLERYQQFEAKYNTYGVFELSEGVALRHHTQTRIDELTCDFAKIIYKPVTYTTMNGHRSKGFYYIGTKNH